jgi:hypothetical protein
MPTFLGIYGSMSCVLLSEAAHVSLLGVLRGCDIFAAEEHAAPTNFRLVLDHSWIYLLETTLM